MLSLERVLTTSLTEPPTVYRCRDEDCRHAFTDDQAHFCPRCGTRSITVSDTRRVVNTRSQRGERTCALCGLVAANRRLFKVSEGRHVCVDSGRCARRQETNAE